MSEHEYNVCVTITTGRSGSTFLQNVFQRNYPEQLGVLHESLHPGKAKPATYHRRFDGAAAEDIDFREHMASWRELLKQGPVVDFGWVLGGLAPAVRKFFGARLKVLILTAHPVSVAASFANRGHYSLNKNPAWAISPFHENVVFHRYRSQWARMSPFEKGLFRWLEITRFGLDFQEQFPEVECLSVKNRDLFSSPARAESIAKFIGFESRALSYDVHKNESAENHVERRPIGNEWRKVFDMSEVVELAETLGFDMQLAAIEKLVSRYQLNGLLSHLRHGTGYWALRERLGAICHGKLPI
jgi:hypothetical protein